MGEAIIFAIPSTAWPQWLAGYWRSRVLRLWYEMCLSLQMKLTYDYLWSTSLRTTSSSLFMNCGSLLFQNSFLENVVEKPFPHFLWIHHEQCMGGGGRGLMWNTWMEWNCDSNDVAIGNSNNNWSLIDDETCSTRELLLAIKTLMPQWCSLKHQN